MLDVLKKLFVPREPAEPRPEIDPKVAAAYDGRGDQEPT